MTAKRHMFYCKLIISVVSVLLFACSKPILSPDQMDKSPFTSVLCAAPCWYGLAVGESSENDVMATLPTLTFIDQSTIQVFRGSRPTLNYETFAPGAEITADCEQPKQKCLSITVADGVLTNIVTILNYEMRADEAIGYLGKPDYVGYQDLGAERIICEVYLIWSSKQLVLASARFEGLKAVEANCGIVRDTGKIRSSLLISEARYLSPTAIEILLSTGSGEFLGTIPEQ